MSRGTGFEDLQGRWPSPGGAGPVAGVTGQLRPSRRDAGAGGAIFPGYGRGHRSVPIFAASEEGEVSDQTRPTPSSPDGYEQQEWVGS